MIHIQQYFVMNVLMHSPKIDCHYADINMRRDTTHMKVLLVVDASTRYLGATDVDQSSGSSGMGVKWIATWLASAGYARMKVRSDAERTMEHLLKADCLCTVDLIVQRALVKESCISGTCGTFCQTRRKPVPHDSRC